MSTSQHSPLRIKPHRGQVREHSIDSSGNKGRAVFHEDEAGLNFANDAGHLEPKAGALPVKAGSLSCDTDVLAGESSGDDVNEASPWSAVEFLDISKDGEPWKDSVSLSGE